MALTISGSGGGIPSDVNQVVLGSYEGTGTYGASNPTSIPCPLGKPKMLVWLGKYYVGYNTSYYAHHDISRFLDVTKVTSLYNTVRIALIGPGYNNDEMYFYAKFSDNRLSFYSTKEPAYQHNSGDCTYYYLLIY